MEDFIAVASMEPSRLMYINCLGDRNTTMYKSRSDVTVDWYQIHFDGKGHHYLYRWPLNDWSPGFEVINSFLFPITSCTKLGLKLLDLPIWISFDFEGPRDWEDVFTGVWNVFPTIKFFGESALHARIELEKVLNWQCWTKGCPSYIWISWYAPRALVDPPHHWSSSSTHLCSKSQELNFNLHQPDMSDLQTNYLAIGNIRRDNLGGLFDLDDNRPRLGTSPKQRCWRKKNHTIHRRYR